MLKQRLIFTLLYDRGNFMLSRNFRLQKVGDIDWLQKNYNFSSISHSIDELIILDVSRGDKNINDFSNALKKITHNSKNNVTINKNLKEIIFPKYSSNITSIN